MSSPPAYARSVEELRPGDTTSERFELILEARRHDTLLAPAILGFQSFEDDAQYLPAGDLARIVGFSAETNLRHGTIEGWFLEPENRFLIDAKNLSYTLRGETFPLQPEDIFVQDQGGGFGDVYVRADVLNRIWPLDLTIDMGALRLNVGTAYKLPYELKEEREKKHESFLNKHTDEIDFTGFQNVQNPYRLYSPPIIDLTSDASWNDAEKREDARLFLAGKNDLLGFSADYSMNLGYRDGEIDLPDQLRLTLERQAFGAETMPLGVRNLSIGDVSARTSEWIRGSNAGRGVSVSSRPLKRRQVFDEVTIEGTATPGWEIEIYRNNELIDFGIVGETGQYRFDSVQLQAGGNKIRTVLYGPQGQVEERNEEYRIGSSLAAPGETFYEASLVDTSRDFVPLDTTDNAQNNGIAYSGMVTHGLSRNLTVFGSASKSMTREGEKQYLTAGVNTSLGPVTGKLEAYNQIGGGYGIDGRASTSLKGWNLNLRTALFHDFESDRAGYDESARTLDAQFRASKRIKTPLGPTGFNVSALHQKRANGLETSTLQVGQTISHGDFRAGSNLRTTLRDRQLSTVRGRLDGSWRINREWQLRSILDYDVRPDFALDEFTADILYRPSSKLSAGLTVGQDLQDDRSKIGANINYDFGTFLGGVQTNWQKDDGYKIALRASTSLAPFGKDGRYIASSRSQRLQNALYGHVFLDKNLDGVFDAGDEPVPDTRLLLNDRKTVTADDEGYLTDVQSEAGDYAALTFDPGSAENPFLVPMKDGYRVLLRPGVAQGVRIPLVEAGLIDGTAFFENGKSVPGLRLQLVDAQGAVVKESMTGFDGFYTFEQVKPGDYTVRADPALDVNLVAQAVSITPENLFLYGTDLDLLEKEDVKNARRFAALAPEAQYGRYTAIVGTLKKMQKTLSGI
ncbi:MAG: carboxypeptidase regulatory-like domain-containing protein [Alphaproteobacteria bacterium]|nr:carboxypeptidase regulatory-like domain-containing protein [Alphaproteobacteria bacterium]